MEKVIYSNKKTTLATHKHVAIRLVYSKRNLIKKKVKRNFYGASQLNNRTFYVILGPPGIKK